MILVTVGTALPFDRLVRAADVWAAEHKEEEVFAQVGVGGTYEPQHMRWAHLVTPQEFSDLVEKCRLLIAHAGTGSFFVAAEKSRPLVMLPRRLHLKEQNTEHQVHTAQWLRGKPGVYVAMTEEELPGAIAIALRQSDLALDHVSSYADEPFLRRIRQALLD